MFRFKRTRASLSKPGIRQHSKRGIKFLALNMVIFTQPKPRLYINQRYFITKYGFHITAEESK